MKGPPTVACERPARQAARSRTSRAGPAPEAPGPPRATGGGDHQAPPNFSRPMAVWWFWSGSFGTSFGEAQLWWFGGFGLVVWWVFWSGKPHLPSTRTRDPFNSQTTNEGAADCWHQATNYLVVCLLKVGTPPKTDFGFSCWFPFQTRTKGGCPQKDGPMCAKGWIDGTMCFSQLWGVLSWFDWGRYVR